MCLSRAALSAPHRLIVLILRVICRIIRCVSVRPADDESAGLGFDSLRKLHIFQAIAAMRGFFLLGLGTGGGTDRGDMKNIFATLLITIILAYNSNQGKAWGRT